MSKLGHETLVYNRTKSKAQTLLDNGAVYKQPQEIAREADFIFLMLGYPHDVESMTLGSEGIVQHMKEGSVLVDHTTSSPKLAELISEEAKQRGVGSIDAPVSGGDVGAKAGQVVTMCGGEPDVFDKTLPLLETYSKGVELLGGPGKGQHTKCVNQIMIATTMVGVAEAMIYSHKAGLDIGAWLELINGGSAGSFSLEKLGPRMLRRDFDPGFYVEHFVKDLGIALDEAKNMGVTIPGTAQAHQLYTALKANDGGRLGTQALLNVLESLNNTEIPAGELKQK